MMSFGKNITMNLSTLSPKLQTTISADIVRRLHLRAGQRLNQFVDDKQRIVLEPVEDVKTAFGALKSKRKFTGVQAETDAMEAAVAKQVIKEGRSP